MPGLGRGHLRPLGLGGHPRERTAAFGGGERGRGPAGHPLRDIEDDRGREADPGLPGHRRVPPGEGTQRLQRGTLVPTGPAPAGPVQRGGDGLLGGDFEADGDWTGRHAVILP